MASNSDLLDNVNNPFEKACDGVDAYIFNTPCLLEKENRRLLKVYIERWQRALAEQTPTQPEGV